MNIIKGVNKFVKKFYVAGIVIAIVGIFIFAFLKPDPVNYVAVMGVYLFLTLLVFIISTSQYFLHMISFRKGFYFTFLGIITLALIENFLNPTDWLTLLQLAGVAVFIDLTLFQTPGISKIWNTELNKEEHSLKRLIENDRQVRNNSTKAVEFHRVITGNIFDSHSPQNWSEYEEVLFRYYSEYIKDLGLRVQLFQLEFKPVENIYINIDSTFDKMLKYHSIQPLRNRKLKEYIATLQGGNEVIIQSDLDEIIVIAPFFGSEYGFLLSIVGKGEIEANQIDASYLLNIAYINEWYIS
ncbi:MAG: type II toxin-antitoxin system SpoIISA family toxin [Planococcus donghaensis]